MRGMQSKQAKPGIGRARLTRDAFVVCGIALNVILSMVVEKCGLPLFLDTIGTIIVAWECSPLAAILTALASNLLCLPFSRMSSYFAIVNICIAISASRMFYRNVFKRKGGYVLFALTLALIGGVLGGLIAWSLNTVISVDFVSVPFVDRFVGMYSVDRLPALLLINLILNIADKAITTAIVAIVLRILPARIREEIQSVNRLDDAGRFDMNRLHRRLLAAIALGAVALVVVCAWISVALYTANARRERIEVANGAAQQVVNAVDPRLIDVYLERGHAAQSYGEVRNVLQGIRDNTPYLEYVYIYRISEDGCHVVFDTAPEGEETFEPREVLPFDPSFEPYLSTLLAGGEIDPVESDDSFGWLLTVYQPIYDLDGRCVAYAGVDMAMEDLNDYVRDFLLRVILIASAFLVFSLAIGVRMSGGYLDIIRRQYGQIKDAKEEADYANQAKSHFLANMSHEIRTPINAVLGMNEMILRESESDDVLRYSENIKTAGNTLLGLINDILDFSKIEAGKMDILPVDYDISSLLNDLVTMIQPRANDKNLLLRLDFDEATPRLLHGDEVRVKQVVTNILTNAVKYTETGSVTFHVGYERIADEPDGVFLNVSVSDTGIGIKPEDMKKLFSEFERIEEKRNRNIEGTGLGMNITQRLLEMMGSRLEVASVYGEGSTFSFRLKQKVVKWDALGNYEASYRASISGRRKYRERFTAPDAVLLVVDDTPMNLEVFKSLLKRTGVQIDTAGCGGDGLSLARGRKYDIIFLDHMMPEKDGIETLHELRGEAGSPNLQTPAVCLTANAISGAREQYLAAGFDDYLTKPIDADRLEELIMRYLPREKLRVSGDGAAAGEPSADLPDWLRAVDGLDTERGLSHCGSAESYLDTLTIYENNAAAAADEVEGLWRAGDLANTTVKVHALKSTSRAIGAETIGALAEKLELAGKAGDAETLCDGLPGLLERVRAMCAALAPLRQTASGDAAADDSLPVIPDDKLKEAYDCLRELASNLDSDSAAYIFHYLAGFRIPSGERERVEKIQRAIGSFDWDQVHILLDERDDPA